MSFLDCITAGFGAVVLLYMVMSAQSGIKQLRQNDDLAAESVKMEDEVLEGYRNLVVLRNTLEKTTTQKTQASGRIEQLIAELQKTREELSRYSGDSMARQEHLNKLRADIRSLEEGTRRLAAGTQGKGPEGERLRTFRTGGDRQYLTGIKLKGKNILILVDDSASMLDETLVNILRMRNMSPVQKMLAPKWQRTVATVDWLVAQLPPQSSFQVFAFNTKVISMIEGSAGKWVPANDPKALDGAIRKLRQTAPNDGTSLIIAFQAAKTLNPLPDQIVLVTDGLPTQGATEPAIRKAVDVDQRMRLFDQALSALPPKIPVSTILMPMEGDVPAPSKYWKLARATGGVFMMPSRDWP